PGVRTTAAVSSARALLSGGDVRGAHRVDGPRGRDADRDRHADRARRHLGSPERGSLRPRGPRAARDRSRDLVAGRGQLRRPSTRTACRHGTVHRGSDRGEAPAATAGRSRIVSKLTIDPERERRDQPTLARGVNHIARRPPRGRTRGASLRCTDLARRPADRHAIHLGKATTHGDPSRLRPAGDLTCIDLTRRGPGSHPRSRPGSPPAAALPAFVLAQASPARADGVLPAAATAVQREQAQSRFVRGKDLMARQSYDAALVEFRASHDIVSSPNTRLELARCLLAMGKLVDAYAELGRTAIEAKELRAEDNRYQRAYEAASSERAQLQQKLGF